jgi:hypothetical protein
MKKFSEGKKRKSSLLSCMKKFSERKKKENLLSSLV